MNLRQLIHHRNGPLVVPIAAGLFALGGIGAGAAALASGGTDAPPKIPLARAVHQAIAAPAVQGVSARIHFTNTLVDAGNLPGGGSDPLLSGADGRLWAGRDGRLRIELQSSEGDVQALLDGDRVSVLDPATNTVYHATLPARARPHRTGAPAPPTLAAIKQALARLARDFVVTGPDPGSVAGQPSYTVRIAPRHDGGLLGAAEVAWDAANGVPLRAAVYAQGQSDPVLELEATDIHFGPVPASDFAIAAPAGAKQVQVDLGGRAARPPAGSPGGPRRGAVGLDAVRRRLSFPLAAPASLAGLPRRAVHEIRMDGRSGALVTYGQGGGLIAVVETPASGKPPAGSASGPKRSALAMQTLSIDGATAHELATALGTIVTFQRGGVSYAVIGSVPPAAAEAAARAL